MKIMNGMCHIKQRKQKQKSHFFIYRTWLHTLRAYVAPYDPLIIKLKMIHYISLPNHRRFTLRTPLPYKRLRVIA